jgi:flagellar motor switch protein FliG
MDAELQRQVLERLEKLEQEIVHFRKAADFDFSEEIALQKTKELVADLDPMSLQLLLRQVTQDQLAPMFYGMPRETITKVKASLSKTIWSELLESWTSGFGSSRSGACQAQNDLLKIVRQLEEMGEIVWVRGEWERLQPLSKAIGPVDLETYRKEERLQREKELADARRWVKEELAGLV